MIDFIPYNESLELKKLGFDEECFGLFTRDNSLLIKEMPNQEECQMFFGGILAPTFFQCFRWFREKYGLISYVHPLALLQDTKKWCYEITNFESSWDEDSDLHTLEEAELACLNKLIEIVKL